MKISYFSECRTAEEVKATYYRLVKEYHPDLNPTMNTTAIMQEINLQYTEIFPLLRDVHLNSMGETYTSRTPSDEIPEDFRSIIEQVIHFENCYIEIIGSWVWVSGGSYPYRKLLKEMGFQWSANKSAWYYHRPGYVKRSSRLFDMQEIRGMFGSQPIDSVLHEKLTAF